MPQIPPQNYWTISHGVFSLMPALLGINAILRPNSFYGMLKVAPPKDPAARKLADAQILMYGARDLTVGLACLAAWHSGNQQTMGLVLLATLPMAIIDAFAVGRLVGEGEWIHWATVPVLVGIGAGCLGWI